MEHLRDGLAHELEQVAVGRLPGDLPVVAEGVEVEVPGGGQDDGHEVAGRHPHQDSVGGRPHAGPEREEISSVVVRGGGTTGYWSPGEYEDDQAVEDESDEDELR